MLETLGWIAIALGIALFFRSTHFRKSDEARWRFYIGLLFVELGICFSVMLAVSIAQDRAYFITAYNGSSHGTTSSEADPTTFVISQSLNAILAIYSFFVGVRCFRGHNPWRP